MSENGNTRTELKLKRALGARGAAHLQVFAKAVLRGMSYLPLQALRIQSLKLAGAKLGIDIVLGPGVEVFSPWRLSIGNHTNIGRAVHLDSRGDLKIGDNVNISDQVAIWTAEHDIQSEDFVMTRAPVVIQDRVWVCFRSIVMPGVTLGEGAIVASGAVVTKDVEPFTVVGGTPAKVISKRTDNLTYQLGDPRRKRKP